MTDGGGNSPGPPTREPVTLGYIAFGRRTGRLANASRGLALQAHANIELTNKRAIYGVGRGTGGIGSHCLSLAWSDPPAFLSIHCCARRHGVLFRPATSKCIWWCWVRARVHMQSCLAVSLGIKTERVWCRSPVFVRGRGAPDDGRLQVPPEFDRMCPSNFYIQQTPEKDSRFRRISRHQSCGVVGLSVCRRVSVLLRPERRRKTQSGLFRASGSYTANDRAVDCKCRDDLLQGCFARRQSVRS